jgi:glutamate carboxypeptidase
VVAVEHLADPAAGTTVTPTMATAGSSPNTVPSSARVAIDVRAATVAEQQRVDKALRDLRVPGEADVRVEGGINRAPMEEAAAEALYLLAKHVADRCGLPPLRSARVGGGSDGNFTAALGIPTLDGLGAVGAGAHAEGEYIVVPAMPQRAALLAGLIVELGKEPR